MGKKPLDTSKVRRLTDTGLQSLLRACVLELERREGLFDEPAKTWREELRERVARSHDPEAVSRLAHLDGAQRTIETLPPGWSGRAYLETVVLWAIFDLDGYLRELEDVDEPPVPVRYGPEAELVDDVVHYFPGFYNPGLIALRFSCGVVCAAHTLYGRTVDDSVLRFSTPAGPEYVTCPACREAAGLDEREE